MSTTTLPCAAPRREVAKYMQEKRTIIAEVEGKMAIFYRTFASELIEPLSDCPDLFTKPSLSLAMATIETPDEYARLCDPERLVAISERYTRLSDFPVAVVPLKAKRVFRYDLDCSAAITVSAGRQLW